MFKYEPCNQSVLIAFTSLLQPKLQLVSKCRLHSQRESDCMPKTQVLQGQHEILQLTPESLNQMRRMLLETTRPDMLASALCLVVWTTCAIWAPQFATIPTFITCAFDMQICKTFASASGSLQIEAVGTLFRCYILLS